MHGTGVLNFYFHITYRFSFLFVAILARSHTSLDDEKRACSWIDDLASNSFFSSLISKHL